MRAWRKFRLHDNEESQPRPIPSILSESIRNSKRNDELEQVESSTYRSPSADIEGIEQEALTSDNEASFDSGRHGMFILADKPKEEIGISDIIAIHGLNGHYRNTWTAVSKSGTQCNWLQDLLPKQIPNARIMSYGYNSAVQFSKSTADVGTFADGLLEEIMSYRGTNAEKARPIIFICHSLGGIVFKKAVVRAWERDRYTELLRKIRGVVFFGTPHRGSNLASWADIFANTLRAASFGTSTNRRLTKDLKTQSEVLVDISRSFVDRSKSMKIISFYESDAMEFMNCKVVSAESAVLHLPNEIPIMMNGNHRSICRFSDSPADEKRYSIVWKNLKAIADELISTEVTHITNLSKAEQALCMKKFSRVNYESFRNRNPERVPMTCEWFLQHPKYKTWRNKESSSLLWVSADPGCGKSVLAKFLVGQLRHTKSEAGIPELVCHFFFKDDNDAQRNSVTCLNALLHQVFKDDESLLRHVFPIFESEDMSAKFDFNSLWKILFDISQDPEATNLICILDGLDECEESSQLQLLRSLHFFYSPHSNTFLERRPFMKFIIFSRPENSIKSMFSNLTEIRLRGEDETEAISRDVERVIQHSIDELGMQGLPSRLLASFQRKLVEDADRTFLWTTLMIQLLKEASINGISQEDLQMLLESRDLYVLYNHLLQNSVDKAKARNLLQIILAATRPLTLDEINVAVNISPCHSSLAEVDSTLKYPCENYIKSLCGHFIRIIKSKVYLVHQTAKEFLLQQQYSTQGTNIPPTSATSITEILTLECAWQHSLSMKDSEKVLLTNCIKYLTLFNEKEKAADILGFPITRKRFLENSSNHHFLEYSSAYWPTHFRRVEQGISDILIEDALNLCDPSFPVFKLWSMSHNYDADRFATLPRREVQLRIATILELEALVTNLFERYPFEQFNLTSADQHGQRALHLTCWNSNATIARLLLDHGARTEDTDENQQTPLHFVSFGGVHNGGLVDVASTLIKYGADVEVKDKDQRTPLHLAVISNNTRMVEFLLSHGGNAETYDKDQRTPLLDAVSKGRHNSIVKELLKHGADVNARDEKQKTPLHLAALSGDLNTIKEILEVKPDVTLQDVNGDTALHVIRRKPTLDLRDASARSSLIPQVKDSSTFLGGSLSPRKC